MHAFSWWHCPNQVHGCYQQVPPQWMNSISWTSVNLQVHMCMYLLMPLCIFVHIFFLSPNQVEHNAFSWRFKQTPKECIYERKCKSKAYYHIIHHFAASFLQMSGMMIYAADFMQLCDQDSFIINFHVDQWISAMAFVYSLCVTGDENKIQKMFDIPPCTHYDHTSLLCNCFKS